MDNPNALSERLDALEIKACQADDLLDELNLAIYRQQQQIDRLLAEVTRLHTQLPEPAQSAASRNLRDELPPHY